MRQYQDEIVGGDNIRRYKLVDDNGNVIYSGLKIEKDYIPEQEGTTFGASDILTIQNYIATGWVDLTIVLTFISFASPTVLIACDTDITSKIKKGCRIRFKQGTTTFYGIITAITSSQITVSIENGTVTNATITDVFFSNVAEPSEYPTPTVDYGSNANGSFIKFVDGTMWCRTSKSSPAGSTANGNGFISGATTWTFPAEFISRPIVTMSPIRIVAAGANPTGVTRASSADFTKTAIDNIFVWYNQASATVQTEITLVAIGRWK